jgi:hypothetical protein
VSSLAVFSDSSFLAFLLGFDTEIFGLGNLIFLTRFNFPSLDLLFWLLFLDLLLESFLTAFAFDGTPFLVVS